LIPLSGGTGCRTVALNQVEGEEGSMADVGVIRCKVELASNGHPLLLGWLRLPLPPSLRLFKCRKRWDGRSRRLYPHKLSKIVMDVAVAWETAKVRRPVIDHIMILAPDQDIGGIRWLGVAPEPSLRFIRRLKRGHHKRRSIGLHVLQIGIQGLFLMG